MSSQLCNLGQTSEQLPCHSRGNHSDKQSPWQAFLCLVHDLKMMPHSEQTSPISNTRTFALPRVLEGCTLQMTDSDLEPHDRFSNLKLSMVMRHDCDAQLLCLLLLHPRQCLSAQQCQPCFPRIAKEQMNSSVPFDCPHSLLSIDSYAGAHASYDAAVYTYVCICSLGIDVIDNFWAWNAYPY